MNYKENKQIVFIISGLFLIFALCFYVFSLYISKITNTDTINYSEQLSGFQIGTTAKIEYLTKNNSAISAISVLNSDPITNTNQTHILQKSEHYSVNFIIQVSNRKHLDIEMNINKKTNNFQAIISGLPQKSNVSLNLGKQNYYTAIPVDWAGRLTLQLENTAPFIGKEVCLKIKNLAQQMPYTICHHIMQASERQVTS